MSEPNEPGPPDAQPINPYAPTASVGASAAAIDDAEQIRKQYINHEASVKSIGLLYLLGGAATVAMGLFVFVPIVSTGVGDEQVAGETAVGVVIGFVFLALGATQFYTGLLLRRLSDNSRIFGALFAVLMLLNIPCGTLLGAYFLYVLLGAKGKVVCSEHYRHIVAQTPHIRYKTSTAVWILLALVVVAVAVALLAAYFG